MLQLKRLLTPTVPASGASGPCMLDLMMGMKALQRPVIELLLDMMLDLCDRLPDAYPFLRSCASLLSSPSTPCSFPSLPKVGHPPPPPPFSPPSLTLVFPFVAGQLYCIGMAPMWLGICLQQAPPVVMLYGRLHSEILYLLLRALCFLLFHVTVNGCYLSVPIGPGQ